VKAATQSVKSSLELMLLFIYARLKIKLLYFVFVCSIRLPKKKSVVLPAIMQENSIYFTGMINDESIVWDPYYMATNINKRERIQWQAVRFITGLQPVQETIFRKKTQVIDWNHLETLVCTTSTKSFKYALTQFQ